MTIDSIIGSTGQAAPDRTSAQTQWQVTEDKANSVQVEITNAKGASASLLDKLNTLQGTNQKGVAGGYPELDGDGKILVSRLPDDAVTASDLATANSGLQSQIDAINASALTPGQLADIAEIDAIETDLTALIASHNGLVTTVSNLDLSASGITQQELDDSQEPQDTAITTLEGQVATLMGTVSSQAALITALQDRVTTLEGGTPVAPTITFNPVADIAALVGDTTAPITLSATVSDGSTATFAITNDPTSTYSIIGGSLVTSAAWDTEETDVIEITASAAGAVDVAQSANVVITATAAPTITFDPIPAIAVSAGDTSAALSLSATASDGSTVTFALTPDPTPGYTLSGNVLTSTEWGTAGTDAVVIEASAPGASPVDQQVNIIIEAMSDLSTATPNQLDGSGLAPGEGAPGSYGPGDIEFSANDYTQGTGNIFDPNLLQVNAGLQGQFGEFNVTASNGAPVKTSIDFGRYASDPRAVAIDAYNDNGVIRFMVPLSGTTVDTDGTGTQGNAIESTDLYDAVTEAPVYTGNNNSNPIVRGYGGEVANAYTAYITITYSAEGCASVTQYTPVQFVAPSDLAENMQTTIPVSYDVTTPEGRQARAFYPPEDVVLADISDLTNDPAVIAFKTPRYGISYEDDNHTNTGYIAGFTGSSASEFTFAQKTLSAGLSIFENLSGVSVFWAYDQLHWLTKPAVAGSYVVGVQYTDSLGNVTRDRVTLVYRDPNPATAIDPKLVVPAGAGTRTSVISASEHFSGVEIQTQPGMEGGVGSFFNNYAQVASDLLNGYGAIESEERMYRRHMLEVNQHGYPLIPDDALDFGNGQSMASQLVIRAGSSPSTAKDTSLTGEYTVAISSGEVFARTTLGTELKGTPTVSGDVTSFTFNYDPNVDGQDVQFIYNQADEDTKDIFFGLLSEYARWQNGLYTNLAVADSFNFGHIFRTMTWGGVISGTPISVDAADADEVNNIYSVAPQRSLYDFPDINAFTYFNTYSQRGRGKIPGFGVPIEVQLAIAREIGSKIHLCLPGQMTDAGIAEVCDRIKSQLPGGSLSLFEYFNEVWGDSNPFGKGKYLSFSNWIAKGIIEGVFSLSNGVPSDQSAFDAWIDQGWMKWAGYMSRRWWKIIDTELPDHNIMMGLGTHSAAVTSATNTAENHSYAAQLEGWRKHAEEEGLTISQIEAELQANTMALNAGYTYFADDASTLFYPDTVPNLATLDQTAFDTLFYNYWINTPLGSEGGAWGSTLAGHTHQVLSIKRAAAAFGTSGFVTAVGEYEGGPHTSWEKVTTYVLANGGCTEAEKTAVDALFAQFMRSEKYGDIETDLLTMYAANGVSIKSLYNTNNDATGDFPFAYEGYTLLENQAYPRLKAHTDHLGMTGITQI